MLKSFKFWTIARTAEEAAACAISPGSRYSDPNTAELGIAFDHQTGTDWQVFPVTLTVEVGEPAKETP